MGRYNFSAQQVYQNVTASMQAGKLKYLPTWYETVGTIPPAEIMARPKPLQHRELRRRLQKRKPSKMFHPQKIEYEEDRMRQDFYKDHPWELARPRVILEQDGKDAQKLDWSTIEQRGRPLNAESVVQRQLWLLNNELDMTYAGAYDKARHEFYKLRMKEETELRIAKEEAMATGAYFGKSYIEIGMDLEDKEYERWKEWAKKEIQTLENVRNSAYTEGPSTMEESPAEVDAEMEVEEGAEGAESIV